MPLGNWACASPWDAFASQDSLAHSAAQAFTGSIKMYGLLLGWSDGALWS